MHILKQSKVADETLYFTAITKGIIFPFRRGSAKAVVLECH
jgi:hypothetical protein